MDRIFCVEDDQNIRELIEYTLSSSGFTVEGFENGSLFFDRIKDELPDLVLLDIMLPDMDGMEILKRIREDERTKHLFVILITAKSERMDKIRGLDLGADDYITKPFDVLELISRVKAILRRAENRAKSTSRILECGAVMLDTDKYTVTVEGSEVSLTHKEFELLKMLIEANGNAVTREKIISDIWETDFEAESRTLDVHIRTLRQKLGDAGSYIETVRNVGYKINSGC